MLRDNRLVGESDYSKPIYLMWLGNVDISFCFKVNIKINWFILIINYKFVVTPSFVQPTNIHSVDYVPPHGNHLHDAAHHVMVSAWWAWGSWCLCKLIHRG